MRPKQWFVTHLHAYCESSVLIGELNDLKLMLLNGQKNLRLRFGFRPEPALYQNQILSDFLLLFWPGFKVYFFHQYDGPKELAPNPLLLFLWPNR